MQDRHHLVPLWRPAVWPQVWVMDLLWLAGYEHRHAIFASEVFFSFVKYWQTHWNSYGLACIEVQHYSVSTISSSFQFLEHFVTFCVIKLSSFKIPHFYLSALVVDEGANMIFQLKLHLCSFGWNSTFFCILAEARYLVQLKLNLSIYSWN